MFLPPRPQDWMGMYAIFYGVARNDLASELRRKGGPRQEKLAAIDERMQHWRALNHAAAYNADNYLRAPRRGRRSL